MKILAVCFCFVCFQSVLQAQDYCSLIVKVFRPQGMENPGPAPVTVEERDGRKVQKRYARGGVSFCDLGILPVTVTVGYPGCNQVVVRHVPLTWGRTKTVLVTYDFESCADHGPARVACRFLFRFVDSQGKIIKGATLKVEAPYELTYEADQFGRVLTEDTGYGQSFRGVGIASGYEPAALQLPCTRQNRDAEQYVIMNEAR